jgi:hypothetical protein
MKKNSSQKLILSLKVATIAMLTFIPTVGSAQTVVIDFNSATDYSKNFNSSFDPAAVNPAAGLLHSPTSGTGGSGGMVLTGSNSTNADKAISSIYTGAYWTTATINTLSISLMVNAANYVNSSGFATNQKDKLKVGLGLRDNNTQPTAPKDLFKKDGGSQGAVVDFDLKFEHKSGKGLEFKSEGKFVDGIGGETKTSKLELKPATAHPGPYNYANDWFKLNLELIAVGGGIFNVTYTVENWGPNGTAFQSIIFNQTLTNVDFSSSPTLYAAFFTELEKDTKVGTANLNAYFDQFSYSFTAIPEPSSAVLLGLALGAFVFYRRILRRVRYL